MDQFKTTLLLRVPTALIIQTKMLTELLPYFWAGLFCYFHDKSLKL